MYKVAIIGSGRIAQGFDDPVDDRVLTHVKAYQRHGGFEVVAFCDADLNSARQAAARWGVRNAVRCLEDLKDFFPDVISICVPDLLHATVLKDCLPLQPSVVFCEKPLASTSSEGSGIAEVYVQSGLGLCVNFSRRWMSVPQRWRSEIASGKWGVIQSVRARYYGGWFHNGCHLMDMVSFLLDPEVVGGWLLKKSSCGDADVRFSGVAELKVCNQTAPFFIESLDNDCVAHFEAEMLFEKGSLWLGERNGSIFREFPLKENVDYPGFFELEEIGKSEKAGCSEAMVGAVANIFGYLKSGSEIISSGKTALHTLKLCEDMANLPTV